MFKRLNKKIMIGIIVVIGIIAGVVYYKISSSASIKHIPDGFESKEEHLDMVGVQDSVDFCIYEYDSSSSIEKASGYEMMNEEDVEMVIDYYEDFVNWIDSDQLLKECSEAMTSVSEGDYYMISTKEGEPIGDGTYGKYDNYSVWFYDMETNSLYYIHANV